MKKIIAIACMTAILLNVFTGCVKKNILENEQKNPEVENINIICDKDIMDGVYVRGMNFETYLDLYKFTSYLKSGNPAEKYLNEEIFFNAEDYLDLANKVYIPIMHENDYQISKIRYQKDFKANLNYFSIRMENMSEKKSIAFFSYPNRESATALATELMSDFIQNEHEYILIGDQEICMYYGLYDERQQKHYWYGYYSTPEILTRVAIGTPNKNISANITILNDISLVPLTEYPNLEK